MPCDAEHFEASRACTGGTQFCAMKADASYAWGECVAAPECTNFDDEACLGCYLDEAGVPHSVLQFLPGEGTIGAALVGSGILLGGVGFGTFYFLDRRERQRVSGRVSLSGTAGGALLTTEGRF